MIWRLLHKLFGWHYIAYDYGYHTHVFRVRRMVSGQMYIETSSGLGILGKDVNKYTPLTWVEEDDG